jgi:hypothetical protein
VAKRISVINFKGGVGKTTLSFQLATGLVRYHPRSRVLVVDMDHQSSLSIVCLGPQAWNSAVSANRTINEVFRPFIGQSQHMPGLEIILPTQLSSRHYANLQVVPASLQLDDIEIELTASHHGNAIQSEWNKRTRLKALASMGTPRPMHVPDTALVGVAITRIKTHGPALSGYTDDHTQHLASLQRYWRNHLVRPYIEDGTGVSQTLAEGVPVYDRGSSQNVGGRGFDTMYEQLTSALKARIDAL